MWEQLRRRATFANTVSVVALLVALGGTGYAAVQVTGDDVRDGSLTGADVRDGSLRPVDLTAGAVKTADQAARGPRGRRGPRGFRGLRGRPGAAGPTGATGAPGATGPSGAAAGYAHVNSDGTVDLARSKNITGVNVVPQGSGTYCFRGLAFAFGSIIATVDMADADANATAAIGSPGGCDAVAGTQAAVATSGGQRAFYVVFN